MPDEEDTCQWEKGDLIIYEKQGQTFLGIVANENGGIKPLACALVPSKEFRAAFGKIARLVRPVWGNLKGKANEDSPNVGRR